MKKIRKLAGAIMLIFSVIVMQLPAFGSEAATTTSQSAASDFVVDEDGVLTKYRGISSSVVIPSNVTVIATDAFKDNSSITSVVISNNVKKIEPYAFWNCGNLSMVSIGSGLSEIGDFVFANCKSLASANIPSNIKRIGIYAFQDDISLTDITIPIETMDIHESSFDGCYKLVIHAIEGSYPYKYAEGFYIRQQEFPEYEDVATYNPDGIAIEDITGDGNSDGSGDGNSADGSGNGSTGNGSDSTGGDGSTGNGNDLSSSTDEVLNALSSSHVVANNAFIFMNGANPTVYYGNSGNIGNTDVVDNSDDSSDGTGSGSGTDENAGVDVPAGTLPKYTIVDGKIVADQAYYCSTALSYVSLPQTIKEIGQFAYARSSLNTIVLPDGLETISYGAFYHCDELSFVTIPDSVIRIEPKAFKYTKWLSDFESGNGDAGDFLISNHALIAYRGSSENVTIPDGVRLIASQVFEGHEEIKSVSFPQSVEIIGEEAFCGCSELSTVILDGSSVKNIHDRAFSKTALKEVLLPETIVSLGINAFDDSCVIGYLGNTNPAITHENTAERLSNADFRENAYKTDLTQVSSKEEVPGVKVNGEANVSASLEGADKVYSLHVNKIGTSTELNSAIARASEFIKERNLGDNATYDIVLTDKSGISITRLGHVALTIAIPMPEEIKDPQQLTVLTVDRNGQLEEITPEIVEVEGVKYVRFDTYHLSPFAIYGTGEPLLDDMIITSETVIKMNAAPPSEKVNTAENFANWLHAKRFRIVPAMLLFVCGIILILYRVKKH